jgi:5-methylcytosine-specific restriction protein A
VPVLRVDNEVYEKLREQAVPFEDTPNSVLRRLLALDHESGSSTFGDDNEPEDAGYGDAGVDDSREGERVSYQQGRRWRAPNSNSGRSLNREWGVGAEHALYHKDGTFFNELIYFPGALFDANGYVRFDTEDDYWRSPELHHGQRLNVPDGISSLPGYVRKR